MTCVAISCAIEQILCIVIFCSRQFSPSGAPGEPVAVAAAEKSGQILQTNDRGTGNQHTALVIGPVELEACNTTVVEFSASQLSIRSVLSL